MLTKKDIISFGCLVCLGILACSCNEQAQKASEPRQDSSSEQSAQANDVAANTGRGLRDYEKQLLGLIYPKELLETARIHVGQPQLLPKNTVWGFIVHIAVQNDYGVTVGQNIYFPEEPDTTKLWGIQWLTHELRHVQQYKQAGGLDPFGAAYVWYLTAGAVSLKPDSAYVNNPFENDARVYDSCIAELLGQRPELLKALALAKKDRAEQISREINKYASRYKEILRASLGKATKAPTTFRMADEKSFTIDFHLRGEFTDPVGGEVDLRVDK